MEIRERLLCEVLSMPNNRRQGRKSMRERNDGTSNNATLTKTNLAMDPSASPCPLLFNGPSLPGMRILHANIMKDKDKSDESGDIKRTPSENTTCEPSTSNDSEVHQTIDDAPDNGLQVMLALPAPPNDASASLANLDENNHRYVGLVNQAMTCYLNSLIQTLYMTPEFRNAIYGWKFSGPEAAEAKSIPCQLQKLFLLLQTSDHESLETIDLTASFGWSNSEAYEQHDIQELCRIMFDALKQKWSRADASFQDLYRGSMEDFVKCLFCQKESVKQDEFLDLPLAVKQFGASNAFGSVEEALHAFVKPEVLEGSNQYYCEGCRKKQNALKGLRVTKFPYLLSIQLKRFDFDCNTLHRIKLNDKMTFPSLLNLNEFVYDATKSEPPKKMSWASAVSTPRKKEEQKSPVSTVSDYVSRAEQSNGHLDENEVDVLLKKDGPFLYELFSVMVHQGSASGGHYFAYIKNMDQDKWFCFNDSNVTSASIEDVHRTFGGVSSGWASGNTNAYMLMYRQIDRKRNARFVKTTELADHLVKCLQRFKEQEEEKQKEKEYQESLVSINVAFNGTHISSDVSVLTQAMKFPYTTQFCKIYDSVFKSFCEKTSISLSNVRLLLCKDFTYSITRSLKAGEMEKTLEEIYPECAVKSVYRPVLYFLLDMKPSSMEHFYFVYDEATVGTVKVIALDIENGTFLPPFQMQYHEDELIKAIKRKVAQMLRIVQFEYYTVTTDTINFSFIKQIFSVEDKTHNLRLVVDKGIVASPTMVLLNDDNMTCLQALLNVTNARLYADVGGSGPSTDQDRKVDFHRSKMFSLLERKNHSKILTINFPTLEEYMQAGIAPPISQSSSRSATPARTIVDADTVTSSELPTSIDTRSVAFRVSEILGAKQTTSSMAGSHLSSTVSDQDNSTQCLDDDGDVDSVNTTCTPLVSPVVSDSDDVTDITSIGFARTLDAITAVSEQERLFKMKNVLEDGANTANFSGNTFIEGTQTYISGMIQNGFDAIIRSGSRRKSASCELYLLQVFEWVSENGTNVEVDVDDRQLVINMKHWLAVVLGLDTNEFVVLKHYGADDVDGYESVTNESETIHEAYYAVQRLSIKLRSPLKENEKLLRIIRFDRENTDQDKWPTLFRIPVTVDMSVRTLLMRCQEQLKKIYAVECDLNQLRLRDMDLGDGAPVMFYSDQLGQRSHDWNRNLYLQILTDEEVARYKVHASPAYPVMVRRWKPSLLEVSPLVELIVPVARLNQFVALKEQISLHYRVPMEQILLSEWPYTKDRVDLYENVRFTNENKPCEEALNGKLVYFKLANEQERQLTEEEKRTIRYKDHAVKSGNTAVTRRKERPLRIQLSTSITEDD
ncbi:unnamed protein product [Thelazia callipaeda]|uniref:Ubiquitin carboxyl-terminal hydrolase 47 n=1 Tax=Thelazia callipaeda TaxID=103827 RepID=A0A158RCL4_THECL|nr:unnamed protein product [Thelazia callipaeda]